MFARPILKGVDLFVTRRIGHREFRLRPSPRVNEIIGYLIAVLSKRYRIQIYALTVLSDHYHMALHDPCGLVPDFTRDCHAFIARHLNAVFNDQEGIWAASVQTSHVHPDAPTDTLGRIAYTMANPVSAGLVEHGKKWPGIRRAWPSRPLRFKRPTGFLDPNRKNPDGTPYWPPSAVLELHRPHGFDELSDNELAIEIRDRIREAEAAARAEVEARGGRFLGARQVRKQSRYQRAKSEERRGGISPRIAARDKQRRIERIEANRAWRRHYAKRLCRWRNGERDVVFPHGTYKMRVVHGVNVAPAPT